MVRIARKLNNSIPSFKHGRYWTHIDKEWGIGVDVEKATTILCFNQLTLNLKLPEVKRIAEQLSLAIETIEDRKARAEELSII